MSRMVVSSSLEQLVDMGFEKELARSALETHGENIERACIALLGSEADVANSPERQVSRTTPGNSKVSFSVVVTYIHPGIVVALRLPILVVPVAL